MYICVFVSVETKGRGTLTVSILLAAQTRNRMKWLMAYYKLSTCCKLPRLSVAIEIADWLVTFTFLNSTFTVNSEKTHLFISTRL